MGTDVTGLAVALTATARTRAQQLARDLQAAQRRLHKAGEDLATAKRGYAKAAGDYRDLYAQAAKIWSADELKAAGAAAPPAPPQPVKRAEP